MKSPLPRQFSLRLPIPISNNNRKKQLKNNVFQKAKPKRKVEKLMKICKFLSILVIKTRVWLNKPSQNPQKQIWKRPFLKITIKASMLRNRKSNNPWKRILITSFIIFIPITTKSKNKSPNPVKNKKTLHI
jgi:hypothetical protein